MQNFLSVPEFLLFLFSFDVVLNPKVKKLIFIKSFLIFLIYNLNFILIGILLVIIKHNNKSAYWDSIFVAFSILTSISFLCLNYTNIFWQRKKIQKVIEKIKNVENFLPEVKEKFKNFQKFKNCFKLCLIFNSFVAISVCTYRAFTGSTAITTFAVLPFKLESQILSILINFWSIITQVSAQGISFMTEILTFKLIFVISMEFKELAIKFKNLKNFDVQKNPKNSKEVSKKV